MRAVETSLTNRRSLSNVLARILFALLFSGLFYKALSKEHLIAVSADIAENEHHGGHKAKFQARCPGFVYRRLRQTQTSEHYIQFPNRLFVHRDRRRSNAKERKNVYIPM